MPRSVTRGIGLNKFALASTASELTADQRRRMRFDYRGSGVGTIPRPVDAIRRNSVKIPFQAVVTFVLHEEPDFAFEHMINLLRSVHMRPGI